MATLEETILEAYKHDGAKDRVSKAHLALLKSTLLLPIHKDSPTAEEGAEPKILFLEENSHYFIPVFSQNHYYETWAKDSADMIDTIELPANEVISGLGNYSYLCLDIGTPHHKEFGPDEIARLKGIVAKLYPPVAQKDN